MYQQAAVLKLMPMNNATQITDAERALIKRWFEAGAPLRYQDNSDGTITDLNTGLMWEKKSDDGSLHDKDDLYSWSDAVIELVRNAPGTRLNLSLLLTVIAVPLAWL